MNLLLCFKPQRLGRWGFLCWVFRQPSTEFSHRNAARSRVLPVYRGRRYQSFLTVDG
jgi:hypothetical protein